MRDDYLARRGLDGKCLGSARRVFTQGNILADFREERNQEPNCESILGSKRGEETMDWITDNWGTILIIVSGIVTVASAIIKATPSTVDDGWWKKIRVILELLALTPKDRK